MDREKAPAETECTLMAEPPEDLQSPPVKVNKQVGLTERLLMGKRQMEAERERKQQKLR